MIKLYLDEDVFLAVEKGLSLRGYDVLTVLQAQNRGLSDIEQLEFATLRERSIFTFNISDFARIHIDFINKGLMHRGIILSKQLPIGIIIKGLINIILLTTPDEMKNNLIWINDFL